MKDAALALALTGVRHHIEAHTSYGTGGAALERFERSFGLLVNAQARSGRQWFDEAREALSAQGIPLARAEAVTDPRRIERLAKEWVDSGVRQLIVGGGDGTVSAVANALAHRPVVLGVLPMGTGNDFARGIGLPLSVREACQVIAHGETCTVDLGEVNGRFFLNAASMGLTSQLAHGMPRHLKRVLGRFAYPMLALRQALRQRPFKVRLTTESQSLDMEVLQVVVGNGRYQGGGQLIAPQASVRDDSLDIYAVVCSAPGSDLSTWDRVQNAATLTRVGLALRDGRHVDDRQVLHTRTRSARLEARPRLRINVDGELATQTPASFRVVPGALRVFASPHAVAAESGTSESAAPM